MAGLATEGTLIQDTSHVEEFARQCFSGPAGDQVGIELEFLVYDRTTAARHVPIARVADALPPLPGGSRVTFEPGGQFELSGPAAPLPAAVAAIAADVETVQAALREAGLVLAGLGLDPVRPAVRQLRQPRYDAMAAFLGVPYGPLMMCSTASIQVNLDLGAQPEVRWERAHLLGPVLTAVFANSPLSEGAAWGWMSGRQAVWEHLDPSRTAPVPASGDPATAWANYLLDARVMLLGEDEEGRRRAGDGSTFRELLAAPGPRPTTTDLAYHATTLFPPVRPRGWLEIRYLDAQRAANWPVCVAVTHALVTDDRAADTATAAAEPYRELWSRAARCGLADPLLRRAADTCLGAALDALPRLGADPALIGEVAAFADRHVTPGRSPAMDVLDLARRDPSGWLTKEGRL
ncbi:ergothioneine biosynthesis glutamate--cysteine ligase EgtA [Streptosporangium sp. KLBMP 9127]|nr:ergothioneine biosynthesis glutamate--cysteine ligase EgtA [Streptosporangium sp. KLBMP 9127]